MSQLVDEDVTVDPNFDEDFLLTHRTFVSSSHVRYKTIQKLGVQRGTNPK